MWELLGQRVVSDHLASWELRERLVSRETEDLKGHVDQKVLQASLGVTAMQDSQGLSVSLELMAKLDNGGLPDSRGFKVSLDLQAYLVCLA